MPVLGATLATTTAQAATATIAVASKPTSGHLLIVTATSNSTMTAPTDNGANTWTLADSITAGCNLYVWYRQATATDQSSLTTITLHNTASATVAAEYIEVEHVTALMDVKTDASVSGTAATASPAMA